METMFAIGVGQGLTLSLLLFFKSLTKKNGAWLIGVFILCVTAYISVPLLNAYLGEPRGSFLIDPIILLMGPSFFGYVISLSGAFQFKRLIFHSIPFLLYLPVLIYFYRLVQADFQSTQSLEQVYSSTLAVGLGIFKFIHLLFYVGLSFYALSSHQEKIQRAFSNLRGKDLIWVKYILFGFLILSILSLVIYLIALQQPHKQTLLTTINLLLLMVFLVTMSFYAFQQETIFDASYDWLNNKEKDSAVASGKSKTPKYEKSGLKPDEVAKINNQLDLFVLEKGFLNPDINLMTLSKQISVPPHKLSEVLSKHRRTSFYDFINSQRIEAVKSALNDPTKSHLSVLGIAFDCGYNSKSTFNAAFKKFTGVSPSDFRGSIH